MEQRTLRHPNRSILAIALSLIAVVCLFGVVLKSNPGQIDIRFIPDHLNTIPDDTGWFIVEVNSTQEIVDPDIEIHTNASIETDYTYWPQTHLIEVFLYPDLSHMDTCIEVEVTISSGPLVASDSALLLVWNWTASELPPVIEKRDVFVYYLASNHPELGINETTVWTPIYNCAGIIVVGHYLFQSDLWEMEVAWHEMIPPSDWVHVYLRQRQDVKPSWAGEIGSWSDVDRVVVEVDPPEEIYRAI